MKVPRKAYEKFLKDGPEVNEATREEQKEGLQEIPERLVPVGLLFDPSELQDGLAAAQADPECIIRYIETEIGTVYLDGLAAHCWLLDPARRDAALECLAEIEEALSEFVCYFGLPPTLVKAHARYSQAALRAVRAQEAAGVPARRGRGLRPVA